MTTKQEAAPTSPASQAVAAASEVLASAQGITLRETSDGAVAINIEAPKRRNIWALPVLMFALGVASLAVGYLLHTYTRTPGGYVARTPVMLMMLGALNVALGPLVLLVIAVQGPPRDVALEARSGTLRADRSVAGDRVVSTYSAAEVECLFVEGGVLFATTGKGDQQLLSFGDQKVNVSLATLLASRLWHPDNPVGEDVPALQRWVVMPSLRVDAVIASNRKMTGRQ